MLPRLDQQVKLIGARPSSPGQRAAQCSMIGARDQHPAGALIGIEQARAPREGSQVTDGMGPSVAHQRAELDPNERVPLPGGIGLGLVRQAQVVFLARRP